MRASGPPSLAGFVLVPLLVLGACDGAGDTPSTTGAGASSTTTDAAAGSTTSSSSRAATPTTAGSSPRPTEPASPDRDSDDTGKSELEDGRHFGYWKSFEIGDTTAFGEFDLAYFLTGPEAERAAAAKGDEVTNDYYIVNDNPKLRTLLARGDTKVTVLAGDGAKTEESNVADFAVDRNPRSGFWVTISGGIVTSIEEQYQP